MSKRLNWIDVNKGLAIFLVALGHCTSGGIQAFIYTFHMPFFFFIAGYLLNINKWGCNYKGFVKSRFNRLIIPYFVGEIIYTIAWLVYDMSKSHLWNWDNTKVCLGILYGCGIDGYLVLGDFWFLPTLFLAEIIFLLVARKLEKKIMTLALSSLIISGLGFVFGFYYALPWGIDIALFVQVFLMLGYYSRRVNLMERIPIYILPLLLIMCVIAWHINGRVDINTRIYHDVLFLYLGAVAGCVLLMKLSMLIDEANFKLNAVIAFWGKQSLIILLFHHYIQITIAYIFRHFNPNLNKVLVYYDPSYVIVALIMGMLIPSIIAKYFAKYPIIRLFAVSK